MKLDRKMKRTLILTTLVCLLPLIAGAILYPQLPQQMATHWDANGEPNGWSSRAVAVFGLPALLLGLNFFLPFVLSTDPKRKNMSPVLFQLSLWIVPVISVLSFAATVGVAMGTAIRVERLAFALVGVLFIVIGNYLPKTKQSYTMGIKLPWTLNSEENWNRTHRLAGFLWVAAGILFLLLNLLQLLNTWALPGILIPAVLVPTVYSYLLYRRGI